MSLQQIALFDAAAMAFRAASSLSRQGRRVLDLLEDAAAA